MIAQETAAPRPPRIAHMPLYSIGAMSGFPFVVREHVRFRDVDALGHVNNAVYSTYLEQARLDALGELGSVILARVEIDFRAEIRFGDEVEVHSRCSRIGTRASTWITRSGSATASRPRRRACWSASTTSAAQCAAVG